jgi:hypothetical protein
MEQAKNLGSVMKFSLSDDASKFIDSRFTNLKNTYFSQTFQTNQTQTHKNCSLIIDDICKQNDMNNMRIYIYKLSEYLQKVFNREAKSFLELNYN